jgi:hypothetical protein
MEKEESRIIVRDLHFKGYEADTTYQRQKILTSLCVQRFLISGPLLRVPEHGMYNPEPRLSKKID